MSSWTRITKVGALQTKFVDWITIKVSFLNAVVREVKLYSSSTTRWDISLKSTRFCLVNSSISSGWTVLTSNNDLFVVWDTRTRVRLTLAGTPGLHFSWNFMTSDSGQCSSYITESLLSVKSFKVIDFPHLASSSFDCRNRNTALESFLSSSWNLQCSSFHSSNWFYNQE